MSNFSDDAPRHTRLIIVMSADILASEVRNPKSEFPKAEGMSAGSRSEALFPTAAPKPFPPLDSRLMGMVLIIKPKNPK